MSLRTLRKQLPVDDWILLPTKPGKMEQYEIERAHSRYVRHLLFDVGRGKFGNLSPAEHAIVMEHCRKSYEGHVMRRRAQRRNPAPFRHTPDGYICYYKRAMAARYVAADLKRNIEEFKKSA